MARLGVLVLLLLTGCMQGGRLYPIDPDEVELAEEELTEPPLWAAGAHPVAMVSGAGGTGTYKYKTSGTPSNGDDETTAQLYRFLYAGRAGFIAEFIDSAADLNGLTEAQQIDLYTFRNLPLWPNNRLRFMSRPGLYFDKVNLKQARPSDVEPWSVGFRYEFEAEVDIIKAKRFVLSAYGSGRFSFGWGNSKVSGVTVNSSSSDYGWEAGVRAQINRWFLAGSWVDRQMRVETSSSTFSNANYGYEGALLTLGLRW